MLKKLNEGDYLGASLQILRWSKAAGKEMPGLVRRRAAEQSLFLS
jgi:lysozyme